MRWAKMAPVLEAMASNFEAASKDPLCPGHDVILCTFEEVYGHVPSEQEIAVIGIEVAKLLRAAIEAGKGKA